MTTLPEWIEFVDDTDGLRILVRREDINEVAECDDGTGRIYFNTDDDEPYDCRDYDDVVGQLVDRITTSMTWGDAQGIYNSPTVKGT